MVFVERSDLHQVKMNGEPSPGWRILSVSSYVHFGRDVCRLVVANILMAMTHGCESVSKAGEDRHVNRISAWQESRAVSKGNPKVICTMLPSLSHAGDDGVCKSLRHLLLCYL